MSWAFCVSILGVFVRSDHDPPGDAQGQGAQVFEGVAGVCAQAYHADGAAHASS
ncbi:hypothetical protein [Sulfuriferula plumbiphila]|uniref:hypothetical protein n=1 Tax=Sulfuriferula plumbiphila TaxID=171865 RepID=UPI0013871D0A|nr:hypothetical protein [Sulfuriferula plumbiphila]